VRGGEPPTITYRRAWVKARQLALTRRKKPLPSLGGHTTCGTPACPPGGVYPTQVAEWAGHSVDVLLRIHAKCIAGQDELAKRRIDQAPRHD